jgi:hypothetical protein
MRRVRAEGGWAVVCTDHPGGRLESRPGSGTGQNKTDIARLQAWHKDAVRRCPAVGYDLESHR